MHSKPDHKAILEALDEAIILVDDNFKFIYANKLSRNLFQINSEDLPNNTCSDLFDCKKEQNKTKGSESVYCNNCIFQNTLIKLKNSSKTILKTQWLYRSDATDTNRLILFNLKAIKHITETNTQYILSLSPAAIDE